MDWDFIAIIVAIIITIGIFSQCVQKRWVLEAVDECMKTHTPTECKEVFK